MNKKLSEHRQVENEVVFRKTNERIQNGFDALNTMAEEEGITHMPDMDDLELSFYCECSDENCLKRIVIKLSLYNDIHNNRKQFLISPDHESLAIESIALKSSNYTVVKKFLTPSETATRLEHTDIVNV
jgi:hypothetical protein